MRRLGSLRARVLLGVDYSRSAVDTLPPLLKRADCRITLVCPRNIPIAKTWLADRVVFCAPGKEGFLRAFSAELLAGDYDWAVIGHDYQRDLLLSCDPAALEWWFSVPVGDRSKHFVFAKNQFLKACRDAGIPVPDFEICLTAAETQAAAHAIGYPVVIKLSSGYPGRTTFLARNGRDLTRILDRIDFTDDIVVQRMIEGPIGSTDVLFDHGRALCRLSSYSGDCTPTPFSPKTARRLIESPVLDDVIFRIGELASYHGLAGVDWVQDGATGEFYVLEITPVPDGGYALTDDAELGLRRRHSRDAQPRPVLRAALGRSASRLDSRVSGVDGVLCGFRRADVAVSMAAFVLDADARLVSRSAHRVTATAHRAGLRRRGRRDGGQKRAGARPKIAISPPEPSEPPVIAEAHALIK